MASQDIELPVGEIPWHEVRDVCITGDRVIVRRRRGESIALPYDGWSPHELEPVRERVERAIRAGDPTDVPEELSQITQRHSRESES